MLTRSFDYSEKIGTGRNWGSCIVLVRYGTEVRSTPYRNGRKGRRESGEEMGKTTTIKVICI